MKKYKFEFDYKFFDCLLLAGQCLLASIIFNVIISFFIGFLEGALMTDSIFLFGIVPILSYIFGIVYSLVAIIRYVLEGVTIKEIEQELKIKNKIKLRAV